MNNNEKKDSKIIIGLKNMGHSLKGGTLIVLKFFKNPVKFVKDIKQEKKDMIGDYYEPIIHNENNVLEIKSLKKYFPIKKIDKIGLIIQYIGDKISLKLAN